MTRNDFITENANYLPAEAKDVLEQVSDDEFSALCAATEALTGNRLPPTGTNSAKSSRLATS